MKKGRLIINASNCHSGGGKTLINAFMNGVSDKIETLIYVDERLEIKFPISSSIKIIRISKYRRYLIDFMIKKIINKNDKIFYFGNLPPFLKFNSDNVLLMLSSRFYVDSINMNGFKIIDRIKIYFEKIYYKVFIKNISQIIVQTSTMRKKLILSGFKKKISVWAFDDFDNFSKKITKRLKKKKILLYMSLLFCHIKIIKDY